MLCLRKPREGSRGFWGCFRDRLVKEMRLRGIKTKEEANEFLEEYLPRYNERFRMCPTNEADAYVRLPGAFDLDRCLCIKTGRTIRNDNTIALDGRLYQVEEKGTVKKAVVEERTVWLSNIQSYPKGQKKK